MKTVLCSLNRPTGGEAVTGLLYTFVHTVNIVNFSEILIDPLKLK